MALNFTTSYTYSPNTTIASSQVNTNFSDIASVFQGLEALTKTFAKLKVDVDPTTALEVATKQYVDHYSTWRRPNLQFASVSTITVESGLDGTSGNIPMLFPDGQLRTETTSTRTTFDITRNAVLVTSGAQSGLTGATSEAANTWYALYAVKVTDSSTLWVTIGSTVLPLQANYATLNTAYGTSGWVYLGMVRNGDNSTHTSDLLTFEQTGNFTRFKNSCTQTNSTLTASGTLLTTSASSANLVYTYAAGTGTAQIPNNIKTGIFLMATGSGTGVWHAEDSAARFFTLGEVSGANIQMHFTSSATVNFSLISTATGVKDLNFMGFWDSALGIGSNPLL